MAGSATVVCMISISTRWAGRTRRHRHVRGGARDPAVIGRCRRVRPAQRVEMEIMHTTVAEPAIDQQNCTAATTATVAICAYSMARWPDIRAAVASVVAQLRAG